MSAQRIKSGALVGITREPFTLGEIPIPVTLVLRSITAGRAISLSFDGGTEFFTPTVDQTSATELVLHVTVPCTHVGFLGAANDTWRVIWNKTDV